MGPKTLVKLCPLGLWGGPPASHGMALEVGGSCFLQGILWVYT